MKVMAFHPARAHSLREVEILFVSWQAVADDQRGMQSGSGGLVGYAVDEHSVAGDCAGLVIFALDVQRRRAGR